MDRTGKDLVKIIIDPTNPEKFFWVGKSLSSKDSDELFQFLKNNVDVFPWSPHEMLGISPEIITHELQISLNSKLVVQK